MYSFILVCFRSSLLDVPSNCWWIDTDFHPFHQLFAWVDILGIPTKDNFFRRKCRRKFSIGIDKMQLDSGNILDITYTCLCSFYEKKLISMSKLVENGYKFYFDMNTFDFLIHSAEVGTYVWLLD